MERGATHFTHWFQPLTGVTAEKHDSFYAPTGDGAAIADFSGKELIQGEPDASSFPTGGIRATFEARGYTAWDPTSPAFLLENPNGALLCIPTAFASWTGEALDTKIPLLRSMEALSKRRRAGAALLGDEDASKVFTTVGPEQEYFLIDEQYYFERPDLVTTGRTLFGAKPPKGHELDDHYFGSIPERVLAYMLDASRSWPSSACRSRPATTRSPRPSTRSRRSSRTPTSASTTRCSTMQILQNVARRYGLVCLLHEKPFAGVNGSGKHNNWSMGTDTGMNLLEPGDTPHENLVFLFFCTAVIAAVDDHRAAARVGRQRRPGPPPRRQRGAAGDHLGLPRRRAREDLQRDRERLGRRGDAAGLPRPRRLGAPPLPMHGGDRNRTSPFAFTGNKFEFRAVGSAVAGAAQHGAQHDRRRRRSTTSPTSSRRSSSGGKSVEEAVLEIVKETWTDHKRVVFDGDNYSEEWHAEAEQRGLANLRPTPDALPWLVEPGTVEVFEKYTCSASASSSPATR